MRRRSMKSGSALLHLPTETHHHEHRINPSPLVYSRGHARHRLACGHSHSLSGATSGARQGFQRSYGAVGHHRHTHHHCWLAHRPGIFCKAVCWKENGRLWVEPSGHWRRGGWSLYRPAVVFSGDAGYSQGLPDQGLLQAGWDHGLRIQQERAGDRGGSDLP